MALAMAALVLVLSGCPGEPAMQRESPLIIIIRVPKREHPQTARFGPADVDALGLEHHEIQTIPGAGRDVIRLTTALRRSTAQSVTYCFVEPVILVGQDTDTTIVEPGECVSSTRPVIDRSDTTSSTTPDATPE